MCGSAGYLGTSGKVKYLCLTRYSFNTTTQLRKRYIETKKINSKDILTRGTPRNRVDYDRRAHF